jgi:DNA-binding MarR family transcriptional regulator
MGFHKSNRKYKSKPFVMLDREMLDSKAWKELTHSEMIAYIYLKKNYNGSNNGQIPLKYSEFNRILAPATISKALKGLENNGWTKKTQHGGMFRYYCLYELTGKYDKLREHKRE